MSQKSVRFKVRQELERAVASCDSLTNHLIQAAALCKAAKHPTSEVTLEMLGEMTYRMKGMIAEFRESLDEVPADQIGLEG